MTAVKELYLCRHCGHARDLHGRNGECFGLSWTPRQSDGRLEHGNCTCTELPWPVKA